MNLNQNYSCILYVMMASILFAYSWNVYSAAVQDLPITQDAPTIPTDSSSIMEPIVFHGKPHTDRHTVFSFY